MKRLCQSVSEHDSLNGSGLEARISSCSNSCCEYDSIGTVSVFIVTVIQRSITLMAGNIIIWSGNSFSTMRLTNKLTELINPVADPRFPIQSSFYRPQRSFHRRLSFFSHGVGCIPACTGADTAWAETPANGYYSGRYASYWNAFLFS